MVLENSLQISFKLVSGPLCVKTELTGTSFHSFPTTGKKAEPTLPALRLPARDLNAWGEGLLVGAALTPPNP